MGGKKDGGTTVDRRTLLKAAGVGSISLGGVTLGSAKQQEETIVLGGAMSLTGDNAGIGRLYKDAYQLTIDRINENGGFTKNGTTYKLEMILRDDATDASNAKNIYTELISQENVKYLLGPYASGVTLPASVIAAKNQLPMVEGGGSSVEIFNQGNEWIFGLLPTTDRYTPSLIEMARNQQPNPKTAAILAQGDTFSQNVADGARAVLKNSNINLAVNETLPGSVSNLSSQMSKVRQADTDLLMVMGHQQHAILMANALARNEVNVDLAFETAGSLTPDFINQTKNNGRYIFGVTSWASEKQYDGYLYGGAPDFTKAIQQQFDYNPDYHSAAGAAVVETFHQAFMNAPKLTPKAVRNTIQNIQFTSAYGQVSFTDKGVIDRPMFPAQWQMQNGELTPVITYPQNVRQSKPVYPMPPWNKRQ